MRTIFNCSQALMNRARNTLDTPGRVFYDEGKFWYVLWIHYEYRQVGVARVPRAPRRSIDDCSPAEWSAAARAAQTQLNPWRPWSGGPRPLLGDQHVEYRLRDGGEYKAVAASLDWTHKTTPGNDNDNDIIAWRFAD